MRCSWLSSLAAAATVAALVAVAACTATTVTESSLGKPPETADSASPFDVDSVAERIGRLSTSLDGYGGTAVDYQRGLVILSWRGALPPQLTMELGRDDTGVIVETRPVPFSVHELMRATDRVVDFVNRSAKNPEQQISTVRFLSDMSGLLVSTEQPGALSVSALEREAGVPVEVAFGRRPVARRGGT